MVGEIILRKANLEDSSLLLEWRNDAETRKYSLSPVVVKPEEHAAWIDKIINSDNNILLIAESDGDPVGAFRLDRVVGDTLQFPDLRLISYVVAPGKRHKGYGTAIVKEASDSYGKEYSLLAQTKRENEGSRKILESCGYLLIGEPTNGTLAYLRHSDSSKDQTVH